MAIRSEWHRIRRLVFADVLNFEVDGAVRQPLHLLRPTSIVLSLISRCRGRHRFVSEAGDLDPKAGAGYAHAYPDRLSAFKIGAGEP
jgi:hypothetical protein